MQEELLRKLKQRQKDVAPVQPEFTEAELKEKEERKKKQAEAKRLLELKFGGGSSVPSTPIIENTTTQSIQENPSAPPAPIITTNPTAPPPPPITLPNVTITVNSNAPPPPPSILLPTLPSLATTVITTTITTTQTQNTQSIPPPPMIPQVAAAPVVIAPKQPPQAPVIILPVTQPAQPITVDAPPQGSPAEKNNQPQPNHSNPPNITYSQAVAAGEVIDRSHVDVIYTRKTKANKPKVSAVFCFAKEISKDSINKLFKNGPEIESESPWNSFNDFSFNTLNKFIRTNAFPDQSVLYFKKDAVVIDQLDGYVQNPDNDESLNRYRSNLKQLIEKRQNQKTDSSNTQKEITVNEQLYMKTINSLKTEMESKAQKLLFEDCIPLRDCIRRIEQLKTEINSQKDQNLKQNQIIYLNKELNSMIVTPSK